MLHKCGSCLAKVDIPPGAGKCKCGGILYIIPQETTEGPAVEAVDHPAHYGGADNPYEAIKVIEAWRLGFHLGNTVKYISRAGLKPGEDTLRDLKKARWYLDRYIQLIESKK